MALAKDLSVCCPKKKKKFQPVNPLTTSASEQTMHAQTRKMDKSLNHHLWTETYWFWAQNVYALSHFNLFLLCLKQTKNMHIPNSARNKANIKIFPKLGKKNNKSKHCALSFEGYTLVAKWSSFFEQAKEATKIYACIFIWR